MEKQKHLTLPILGMTCANCVATVERNLKKVDGVDTANVNLSSERAAVSYDPDKATLTDMIARVQKAGYDIAMGHAQLGIRNLSDAADGGIEYTHGRQILFQAYIVPRMAVQGRTFIGAHQAGEIIDQAEVGHHVTVQAEKPADGFVHPFRTEGRECFAQNFKGRLLFPPPPDHPEMREVKLMGQKGKHFFGMEIGK